MNTNTIFTTFGIALLAAACSNANDSLEAGDLELGTSGKADDASDVIIEHGQGVSRVSVYGEIALDLWDVLEGAGGFDSFSNNGLDYLLGTRLGCVSNGVAAGCQLLSREVQPTADFVATVHGPRFGSAASELFGAIARSQGIAPQSTSFVSSQRFACGKNFSEVWCGVLRESSTEPTLELAFSGLEDLGSDFVYEGWLITADGPVTSGRFSVDDPSAVHSFAIDADLAAASTLFVLTIEPAFGDDPGPASTHVVAGAFDGDTAVLTTSHPAAIGTDFSAASGAYILETPTSAPADDYNQGVWFVDPGAGAASLNLPELPEGWAYEGWVVDDNGPVSTGTFTSTSGADSDGAGPTAGPGGAPPFPGQDFISPARDLRGNAVVISVEPVPDNSPLPFSLKPLVDSSVDDNGPGVLESLANDAAATEITGVATLR